MGGVMGETALFLSVLQWGRKETPKSYSLSSSSDEVHRLIKATDAQIWLPLNLFKLENLKRDAWEISEYNESAVCLGPHTVENIANTVHIYLNCKTNYIVKI